MAGWRPRVEGRRHSLRIARSWVGDDYSRFAYTDTLVHERVAFLDNGTLGWRR